MTTVEHVPYEFRCPIGMEVMKDPVVCEDGHSYDRENIMNWLDRSQTSPMTRQPLNKYAMRPNIALKASIQRWQQEQARPKIMPVTAPAPSQTSSSPLLVYPFTQSTQSPYHQSAYVITTIVPYSTPKVREPTPQQIHRSESQKRTVKIVLTFCSILFFIIILIIVLSAKARSSNENDDD